MEEICALEKVIENYLLCRVNVDLLGRRLKEGKIPLAKNQIEDLAQAIRQQLIKEVEGLKRDRYLTKDKLQYQLGWVEGHRKAIDEMVAILGGAEIYVE